MASNITGSGSSQNLFSQLGLAVNKSTNTTSNKNLNQDDFLKLMTTQMKNQDPFKPMDNTQFIAQMAQFSSLEGINQLNKTVSGFQSDLQSNQVMQAASLVGKAAMVKGSTAHLYQVTAADGTTHPSGIIGAVDVPQGASQVKVDIHDATGKVVKSVAVPTNSSGRQQFSWDGKLADGSDAPAGNYTLSANATVDGKGQAAQTYVGAVIRSVGVSKSGPEINLDGLGSTKLSDIVEIIN